MEILKGSCHCGAVEFEVKAPNGIEGLRRCNCSICKRKGAVMATARIENFDIIRGEDDLSLYQWNTKIAKHYFCTICGIYTHHQRRSAPDEYGFNVGCVDSIEYNKLKDVFLADGATMSLVD